MSSRDTFTAEVPKFIIEDEAYSQWEENVDGSEFIKLLAARDKIESDGVITSAKSLEDGLYEKKWLNGLRLYFAVIDKNGRKTLLLLGSGKGRDQQKAIKLSKKNLSKYKVVKESLSKRD